MLDANAATMSLPAALVKISSNASTTSNSDPVKPRRSTLVLSANSARTPRRAKLREAMDVEVLAVARRLIDLEVAGVDDDAGRRVDRQRDAVGNAVRDADELDRERSHRDAFARPHGESVDGRRCRALRASARPARASAACRKIGPSNHRDHVRDGADVIFVAVRQHQRGGAPFLLQVGQIRNDAIDAQQFGVRNITPASTTMVVSPHVSASMFIPNSPSPPRATTSSISRGLRVPSADTLLAESIRSKGAAVAARSAAGSA